MRISVEKRLLFELEVARIVPIATYMHGSMVITIYFPKDEIIDTCCYLKAIIK